MYAGSWTRARTSSPAANGAIGVEVREQAARVDEVAEAALRDAALEARLGLEQRLRRRRVLEPARVVPGVALVPHPAGRVRHRGGA